MEKLKTFIKKNRNMLALTLLVFASAVVFTDITAYANSTLANSDVTTNATNLAQEIYNVVRKVSSFVAIAMGAVALLIGQLSTDPQRIKQFRQIAVGIGVTWAIIYFLPGVINALYTVFSGYSSDLQLGQ